jgi:hypothetical protein
MYVYVTFKVLKAMKVKFAIPRDAVALHPSCLPASDKMQVTHTIPSGVTRVTHTIPERDFKILSVSKEVFRGMDWIELA